MCVANALFGSKGVTKYDVVEIMYTDDGIDAHVSDLRPRRV